MVGGIAVFQMTTGYDRGRGPLLQVYLVVQERIACAIDPATGHDRGRGPLRQIYLSGYRGLY